MTNISYWGDMLNAVNAWVNANYTRRTTPTRARMVMGSSTAASPRDGTDAGGNIVPITILHHNDSHGNLANMVRR